MTTFLFWNIKRKPLRTEIVNLAKLYNVDIIMLAECKLAPDTLLLALNQTGHVNYEYAPNIGCEKITIFAKFSRKFIQPISEDYRLTIRHLKLPGAIDVLLSVVHFPSKYHWRGSSQTAESVYLSETIKRAEANVGHSRTILVGDLNMNPFEEGVVNANGLHGVMSKHIAQKRSRTVLHKEYPFFYNPMWGLLGDTKSGPPGTFYYSSAEHTNYFWHMYDQILIRPDLINVFDNNDLSIVTSDGTKPLVTSSGIPDAKNASDHLPIVFKLRL